MDLKDTELHPNWRTLATVHLPLKRFIKAGEEIPTKFEEQKYEISVSGEEAKEFYDKILNEKSSLNKESQNDVQKSTNKLKIEIKDKGCKIKLSFDKRNFFRCAQGNDVDGLKKFDPKSLEIDCRDDYGWTALMMAACEGAFDTASTLLSLGADKSLTDKSGKTALDLARKKGYTKIIQLLENRTKTETKNDTKHEKKNSKTILKPFYCEICQRTFTETTEAKHQTSTVHQFNAKSTLPLNKLQRFNISTKNRGLQLMVKQGWNQESGLGPTQNGRLYPVKTVIRKQRTGIGIEQPPARVTHFEAFDLRAIQRQSSDYYKKKPRNRNDISREKVRDWKRERRLRRELS